MADVARQLCPRASTNAQRPPSRSQTSRRTAAGMYREAGAFRASAAVSASGTAVGPDAEHVFASDDSVRAGAAVFGADDSVPAGAAVFARSMGIVAGGRLDSPLAGTDVGAA